jgi:hypothetical protein
VPYAPDPSKPRGKGGCNANTKRTGELCNGHAVRDTDRCPLHSGRPRRKFIDEARVRSEVMAWGLGDSTVDPGEVLLRLVTQSAARVEKYGILLQEAYDAAERLKAAHERGDIGDADLSGLAESAQADLKRVFSTGGISVLVGKTYSATAAGDIYATGEAIRGLAQLEAAERDRCAGFATKAVAAGLAERQVRLAERQGQMLAQVIKAILDDLDLNADQQALVADVVPRHLRAIG